MCSSIHFPVPSRQHSRGSLIMFSQPTDAAQIPCGYRIFLAERSCGTPAEFGVILREQTKGNFASFQKIFLPFLRVILATKMSQSQRALRPRKHLPQTRTPINKSLGVRISGLAPNLSLIQSGGVLFIYCCIDIFNEDEPLEWVAFYTVIGIRIDRDFRGILVVRFTSK